MSNLIHTYFTFFFCFVFRLFDNVSAIRFILSLVKYHNCFITIFLKEKTGKTYRYKHYLQSSNAHTSFFLCSAACCSSSLNISPQEETDESRPLFKVFRYSFSEANDRYFSIALNVFFSLTDSDKILTYD